MTMLMLVAMTSISWLVGDNPITGIIASCLGMMISTLGIDIVSGQIRYNFGSIWLLGGINFIPLVIGFIGMTQLFDLVKQDMSGEKLSYVDAKIRFRDTLLTKDELKRATRPSITAGLMGTFVGFLPGAGLQQLPSLHTLQRRRSPMARRLYRLDRVLLKVWQHLSLQTTLQQQAHSDLFLLLESREAEQQRFFLVAL